ncbi:hypothetical protein UlMin_011148 [Ulmus minor]
MEARLARHHSKSWALATRKAYEKSEWWVVDGEVHEIGENVPLRYMELYQELRENWERLYWDEGYSIELGEDHVKYESLKADDDEDFSPHRKKKRFCVFVTRSYSGNISRVHMWKIQCEGYSLNTWSAIDRIKTDTLFLLRFEIDLTHPFDLINLL